MRSLYKDQLPAQDRAFKKTAAYAARLSEQPEMWPQELQSEMYKQMPYLSDYDVNIALDRVDGERGYAFGYADVHNLTERPEVEHEEAGMPHVRIPIIVKERQVYPWSVLLDGEKAMPLNEDRLREKLFNPATWDLSTTPPTDPSLVEPLMPPQRSGIGMGGDYKLASADERLLAELQGVQGKKKVAFKHISKEQWDAMYNSLEVQKLLHDYSGDKSHPAVQNKVYEMATKMYGYHPKPEPPPPQKLMEYKQKMMEKQQKETQKKVEKGQKMMQEGQKTLTSAGQTKKASASLLLAIAPTVSEKTKIAFMRRITSDPTLLAGLARSGIRPVLEEFVNTKTASANDRLRAIADAIEPTVVTVHKLPGGDFLVKSANNDAFNPMDAQGQVVPGQEAAQAIGPEVAQGMQPGQTASAVANPVGDTEPTEIAAEPITQFGEYLVQDLMGNQIMGWVFPTTLAWDGNFSEVPVALFTNGSAFALQDTIVGELVGRSSQLPMSQPLGEGAFYEVSRARVRATAPVTVRGGLTGPDGGQMYTCIDFMGNQFTVHLSPELIEPQRVSDSEYALPASWKFMRLNGQTHLAQDDMQMGADGGGQPDGGMGMPPGMPQQQPQGQVQLANDPEQMNAAGAVKQAAQSATLFWNGAFNLDGGCGLNKIASKFRHDLDAVSAEFMLGLLGVRGSDIKEKLAQARREGEVKLANLKTITTLAERYDSATRSAVKLASKIPDLRRDFVKEAAGLEDASTVDKILALNFINPENLGTFVDYVPELERTSEQLAEMLLSSYLGMTEVPEGAVERTMKNMEEVIQALKAVEHAEA